MIVIRVPNDGYCNSNGTIDDSQSHYLERVFINLVLRQNIFRDNGTNEAPCRLLTRPIATYLLNSNGCTRVRIRDVLSR